MGYLRLNSEKIRKVGILEKNVSIFFSVEKRTQNQGSAKDSFLSNSFLASTKKEFEKIIFFRNLFWEKRKKNLFSNSFFAKKERNSFFEIFFGEKRKGFFFQNLFSISGEDIFKFFSLQD